MSAINFLNVHFERRVWFNECVLVSRKKLCKKRNRLFLIISQTKRFKHDSFSRKKSKMNYFSHNILFQIPEIFFNVRVFSNLWLVNVFVSYITNKANVFLRKKKSFCGQNPWKNWGFWRRIKYLSNWAFTNPFLLSIFWGVDLLTSIHQYMGGKFWKNFTSFSTKNFVKTNKPFITALVTS